MANEPTDRVELLQGTLDMLILRSLLFGSAHGHQIAGYTYYPNIVVAGVALVLRAWDWRLCRR
jgi:hypothetical protein